MLGVCKKRNARHVLMETESDFFDAKKGVRTLSRIEKHYRPENYHSGSVWSLSTAWASAAEFKWKRAEKGEHFLHKLVEDQNESSLGCIGECWNAETSELTGCGLQLWGAAFAIRIIDEFLLGMRVDAARQAIEVSPCLPKSIDFIKRKKRVGNNWTEITITRSGEKIVAKSSNKKIKILLQKN